jgi:hypothetical protein
MKLNMVKRLVLGGLVTVSLTGGSLAPFVAGSAHAESLSLNVGAAHRCTAPDASSDRSAGEEIPQTTLRVADWCRAET